MELHELNQDEITQLEEKLLDEDEYRDLAMLFKMFADPTRLRIFTVLSEKTVCVDDLKEILGMSQSAISHQLSSLRKMNLVKSHKVGKNSYYSLSDDHVMEIFKQALTHVNE
ncbi:winged helix-turn-helix transcriptional regulator [Erysipelothrix inopinata]|uniref:Winged helix-turn-helix transcriptional regulator n=1 Tax=Erysipelothrix inopinata TaxID=225084 RepID=A0A7G9S1H7_9FIRM|nr:metalloregulator ArsR/SmtB family transcription factor [Erysipelothrix inopinata]QNN61702.1 winged helix-turn-helix transcriptional regulator [Erysipelothrix inopinata]